jgi:hypothetical protein
MLTFRKPPTDVERPAMPADVVEAADERTVKVAIQSERWRDDVLREIVQVVLDSGAQYICVSAAHQVPLLRELCGLKFGILATAENFADPTRFGQHCPYLGCDPVEVEIRAGGEAEDNGAAVDIGQGQFLLSDENAVDCYAQAVGLHCCVAWPTLPYVRFSTASSCCRCGKTSEWPSRMKTRISSTGKTAAAAR